MNRLNAILIATILGMAAVAHSQESPSNDLPDRIRGSSWVPVYSPPSNGEEVSQLALHRHRHQRLSANEFSVWLRWDYAPPRQITIDRLSHPYDYSIEKHVYDCSQNRMRLVEATLYSVGGEVVRTMNFTDEQKRRWHEAVPDSNQEVWMLVICDIMRYEHSAKKK